MPSMEVRYLTVYKKKIAAPKTPAAPTAGATTADSIVVNFKGQTGDVVTDFDVHVRESGADWTAYNYKNSPFTITGLKASTAYEVQVRARNSGGTSNWSPSLTASTTA